MSMICLSSSASSSYRYGPGAIFSASLMGDRKLAKDKCDLVMMPGMMYS